MDDMTPFIQRFTITVDPEELRRCEVWNPRAVEIAQGIAEYQARELTKLLDGALWDLNQAMKEAKKKPGHAYSRVGKRRLWTN